MEHVVRPGAALAAGRTRVASQVQTRARQQLRGTMKRLRKGALPILQPFCRALTPPGHHTAAEKQPGQSQAARFRLRCAHGDRGRSSSPGPRAGRAGNNIGFSSSKAQPGNFCSTLLQIHKHTPHKEFTKNKGTNSNKVLLLPTPAPQGRTSKTLRAALARVSDYAGTHLQWKNRFLLICWQLEVSNIFKICLAPNQRGKKKKKNLRPHL